MKKIKICSWLGTGILKRNDGLNWVLWPARTPTSIVAIGVHVYDFVVLTKVKIGKTVVNSVLD